MSGAAPGRTWIGSRGGAKLTAKSKRVSKSWLSWPTVMLVGKKLEVSDAVCGDIALASLDFQTAYTSRLVSLQWSQVRPFADKDESEVSDASLWQQLLKACSTWVLDPSSTHMIIGPARTGTKHVDQTRRRAIGVCIRLMKLILTVLNTGIRQKFHLAGLFS